MFEEVVCGKSVDICVLILVECEVCDGFGVKKGFLFKICLICYGNG